MSSLLLCLMAMAEKSAIIVCIDGQECTEKTV